jgi:FOG: WD40 repeat
MGASDPVGAAGNTEAVGPLRRYAKKGPPYPGLRPFNDKEHDIFFGRDDQKIEMLQRLKDARFLAVVGASGCGKSSLVHAGLIPSLHAGLMGEPEGSRWQIAVMRPGDRPIERLATALVKQAGLADGIRPALAVGSIFARLSSGPLGLIEVVQDMPLRDRHNLLIVADQFEEIFRFRGDQDEKHTHEADLFVALLLKAAEQRSLPIFVVLTMRSDFIGDCAVFTGLPEAVSSSQYLTPRLSYEQLKLAIVGPARVCGGDVDPHLVARLLNEIGDDPNRLPVLQHALMRMWTLKPADRSVLTLEDYQQPRVEGLDNALSLHADEAYDSLTARQKEIAEVMFRRLCEAENHTRRPTKVGVIAELTGASVEEVTTVANVFRTADTNFLYPDISTPIDKDTRLDISHESLIREWKTLHAWVEQERQSAATYRLLRQRAQKWASGEGDPLTKLDLEQAVKWRRETEPSPLWAKRYDEEALEDAGANGERSADETPFVRTMRFLAESEAASQRDREARQLETERIEAERTARENETKQQLTVTKRLNAELTIEKRKTRKQLRLMQKLCASFALLLVLALVLGTWAFTSQRAVARSEALAVAGHVGRFLDEGNVRLGVITASGALPPASLKDVIFQPLTSESWTALTELLANPLDSDSWAALMKIVVGPQEDAVAALERAVARPVPRILDNPDRNVPPLVGLAASPTAPIIVTATESGKIRSWSLTTGKPLDSLSFVDAHGKPAAIEAVRYSQDGMFLSAITEHDDVLVWRSDAFDHSLVVPKQTSAGPLGRPAGRSIAMVKLPGTEADNREGDYRFVTASFPTDATEPAVWTWDSTHNRSLPPVALLRPKNDSHIADPACRQRTGTTSVDLSADGRLVATGAFDGCLRIWDAETGKPLRWIKRHDRPIRSVRFSPTDSNRLVTASDDHQVGIWTLDPDHPDRAPAVALLGGHMKEVTSAVFDPHGTRVASASLDGTVRIWDAESKMPLEILPGPSKVDGRTALLAFSADGRQIGASFADERTFVWEPVAPRLLTGLSGVVGGTFDQQDRQFATLSEDGIQLWSVSNTDPTSHRFRTIQLKSPRVLAFHPDGREFLTVRRRTTPSKIAALGDVQQTEQTEDVVEIWSALAWSTSQDCDKPLRTIRLPGQPISWAAYAADGDLGGRLIVVASGTSLRFLFDKAAGQPRPPASASEADAEARAGCPTTQAPDSTPALEWGPSFEHQRPIVRAVLADDRQHIATLTDDRTLYLWNMADGTRRTTRLPADLDSIDPKDISLTIQPGEHGTEVYLQVLPRLKAGRSWSAWVWTGDTNALPKRTGEKDAKTRDDDEMFWPISARYGLEIHPDDSIDVKRLTTGETLTQLPAPSAGEPINAIVTSPGSAYLAVVYGGELVRLAWLPSDDCNRPIRYARDRLLPTFAPVSKEERRRYPSLRVETAPSDPSQSEGSEQKKEAPE